MFWHIRSFWNSKRLLNTFLDLNISFTRKPKQIWVDATNFLHNSFTCKNTNLKEKKTINNFKTESIIFLSTKYEEMLSNWNDRAWCRDIHIYIYVKLLNIFSICFVYKRSYETKETQYLKNFRFNESKTFNFLAIMINI